MFSPITLFLSIIAFNTFLPVNAAIFVVDPKQGSTCHGGKPCTVTWVDDGTAPLLSAIGECTVGLYTGNQQLVQTIAPVDVSSAHSLTFTPIPAAGPNSGSYYVSFTSQSAKQQGNPITAFSAFFTLDQMSGSFNSPDPSATTDIPVPSTSSGKAGSITSTITVGNHSTSTSATSHRSSNNPSGTSASASDQSSVAPTTSAVGPSSSPTTLTLPASSGLITSLTPSLSSVPSSLTATANSTAPATNGAINGRVGISGIVASVFGIWVLVLA